VVSVKEALIESTKKNILNDLNKIKGCKLTAGGVLNHNLRVLLRCVQSI
jgi:hypothetical protein